MINHLLIWSLAQERFVRMYAVPSQQRSVWLWHILLDIFQ